jgi:serine/threonine-protein kinase HipA
MTLLQRSDGDDDSSGTSYLELAELIIQKGAHPDEDLEQLWRRIVFNICVSNVDDHLRNHGFILQPDGWVREQDQMKKAFRVGTSFNR